jgi:hypothetical protein
MPAAPITALPDADRTEIMRRLRAFDVPDQVIADSFGLSKQRVHKILGPRDIKPAPETCPPPADAAARLPGALKAWRKAAGLSQVQAAAVLCLGSPVVLNRWERGNGGCSLPGLVLSHIELLQRAGKNNSGK